MIFRGNPKGNLVCSDELNIHIPQSVQEEAELRILSTATELIMNGQSGTNNINIVQDSLLSSFLINKWNDTIPKAEFFNLCMACQDWTPDYILKKIKHIRGVLTNINKTNKNISIKVFTGKGLFSMLLPDDFIYGDYKSILEPKIGLDNLPILSTSLCIYKGVLLTGVMDKKIVSSGRDTLIQIFYKDYSPELAMNFINNTQFLMNKWMSTIGFSIGLEDCIPQNEDEIKNTVKKLLFKSENIASSVLNPAIKEVKINASLNETRDAGLKIAKNSLRKDNNFISTVESGSKGDYFNIAQITGLLGQQNIEGKRMGYFINHGKRSMPYFDFDEDELTIKEKYMAKGFVKNSFIKGLNPIEFYNHAMGGRNNVMDTALKTAETGYLQRRMGKIMEGVMCRYDNTIRDSNNGIIQFVYSGNGFDRTKMTWVETKEGGTKIAPINIKRICDKLNNEDD